MDLTEAGLWTLLDIFEPNNQLRSRLFEVVHKVPPGHEQVPLGLDYTLRAVEYALCNVQAAPKRLSP